MARSYDYFVYLGEEKETKFQITKLSGGKIKFPNAEYYSVGETGFPMYSHFSTGLDFDELKFSVVCDVASVETWKEWLKPFIVESEPVPQKITIVYEFGESGGRKDQMTWCFYDAYPVGWKMEGFTTKGVATVPTIALTVVYSSMVPDYKST